MPPRGQPEQASAVVSYAATDAPPDGTFQAIFQHLRASSIALTGPVEHRLLTIPLLNEAGAVAGGLWGCTVAGWLVVEMLFVPQGQRDRGVGTALIRAAETEARVRDCRQAMVDTVSSDAARFFERLGFIRFGELPDFPPGHRRIFYQKTLSCPAIDAGLAAETARIAG